MRCVPGRQGTAPEGDTQFNPVDPTILKSPMCDVSKNLTSFAGSCIDSHVDSSKLPDWSDTEVYGEGGTQATPNCFDVSQCFAKARPITVMDMVNCTFPLPAGANGAHWNCALATTDGTGACDASGLCLVPLETDPNEGFTVMNGNTIQMVPGVCNKIRAGAKLYADNSAACAQKIEGAPVCQPAEGTGGTPASDGRHRPDGRCRGRRPGRHRVARRRHHPGQRGVLRRCRDARRRFYGLPAAVGANGSIGPGVSCADPDAGTEGGIPACGGSCGSRSCAADPTTGVPLCQPSSGCRVTGEDCTADGDCCGGGGDAGGVTCMSINACGVGVCQAPRSLHAQRQRSGPATTSASACGALAEQLLLEHPGAGAA